jgi:integrase
VPLTVQEARRFVEVVADDENGALYVLALLTGMRQGELLGLRWQDVDLSDNTLTVRHSLQRIRGEWRLLEPKSQRGRRRICIPKLGAEVLAKHRAEQTARAGALGGDWNELDLVFCGPTGAPLDCTGITKRLRSMLTRNGMRPIRFHDLRHSCASFLFANGASLRDVMDHLGHSQVSLTLDTYTHALPGYSERLAAVMDGLGLDPVGVNEGVNTALPIPEAWALN